MRIWYFNCTTITKNGLKIKIKMNGEGVTEKSANRK